MEEPTQRAMLITNVRAIYHNAYLSAHQRQQQADDLQRRIVALQIDRGVDSEELAAAMAEQAPRTQLAAQATRNTAAARSRVIDAQR